ncbi:MAG: hypothetical protein KY397_00065 [Gemmatimonadetes bacterium]|nr:hypothetical protein [Gemmatimonadota bacterium]
MLVVVAVASTAHMASAQETPPDTAGVEVRPAEPIPVEALAGPSIVPADTIPLLAPRFLERGGPQELARVPSEDVLPKNPRNAAIRSFLIPGWGQFYTGHPLRGVGFAVAEATFFTLGYRKQQDVLDKRAEIAAEREAFFADPPEGAPEDSLALEEQFRRTPEFLELDGQLEDLRERRNDWYAYGVLSVIFAAVDAYASAQLDPLFIRAEPAERRIRAGLRLRVGSAPDRGSGP